MYYHFPKKCKYVYWAQKHIRIMPAEMSSFPFQEYVKIET